MGHLQFIKYYGDSKEEYNIRRQSGKAASLSAFSTDNCTN
jgi:hypothetical protein